MREEYYLAWSNVKLGRIIRNEQAVVYSPFYNLESRIEEWIAYPDPLFNQDRTTTPWRVDKYSPKGESSILEWLKERVFSKERENCDFILKNLGLVEYDLWEVLKVTEGKTLLDKYNIQFVNSSSQGPVQLSMEDFSFSKLERAML
jgi:hypothetical protein